ncbi:MAG: peptidylprolyl isomerase [Alphaproteobacteria bacterium]|nr:peptidylprolyl isomerase [Alphaproteobacteria bacterium]
MPIRFKPLAVPFIAACGLAAIALAPVPVQAQTAETVVAIVDGSEITLGDLVDIHQSLPAELRNAPFPALYPQLRERAIDSVLLLKGAEKDNLGDDAEVAERLADAKKRIMQQIYLERAVASALTEDAIKQRYDENYLNQERPTEVRARHILLDTQEAAQAVIDELDAGADFATLAKEKSTGPSGANGGDLGYFEKERMVPEFAEAAFTQQVGTYTKSPVQTQFGWHVILVEDKREQQAPSLDQVRGEIENELSRDAINGVIEGLRENREITLFAIDGSPEPAE